MYYSKLSKLIEQLLEIQNTRKVQVVINFMGHTDGVRIDIYAPKWESGKSPDLTFEGYVDREVTWERFQKEVNEFIKLFNVINQ